MFITKKQIRKELIRLYDGFSIETISNIYQWVISTPFWTWKDRLWCAKYNRDLEEYLDDKYEFITRKHHL